MEKTINKISVLGMSAAALSAVGSGFSANTVHASDAQTGSAVVNANANSASSQSEAKNDSVSKDNGITIGTDKGADKNVATDKNTNKPNTDPVPTKATNPQKAQPMLVKAPDGMKSIPVYSIDDKNNVTPTGESVDNGAKLGTWGDKEIGDKKYTRISQENKWVETKYLKVIPVGSDTDDANKDQKVDKTKLAQAIKDATAMKSTKAYTEDTKANQELFDKMIAAATKINDDKDATQKEVDTATDGLTKAMSQLKANAQKREDMKKQAIENRAKSYPKQTKTNPEQPAPKQVKDTKSYPKRLPQTSEAKDGMQAAGIALGSLFAALGSAAVVKKRMNA